jgi:transcriptional regulator GlxA family with amidase domain
MHTMMDEPWTIQMLAREAGISRAALARHFKSALGIPVMEYLHRIRIAHAKQMLLEGASLGEVAVSVGYASAESFRKAFKRSTGQTPTGYLGTSQLGM